MDKILQLESYYRFIINKNNKEYNDMDLVKFINKQSTYYDNFISKWVNKENILSIEYYELIQNPKESIQKIFAYIYPTLILNKDVIENITEINFSINNKSCMYNNTSSKIIVKNNMESIKYNYIKDIIYSTNS
jgi:glycerol-3-phosphate responsive antiterminator